MIGVLLVDDEQFVRMGLRNLIDWRSCGYEIVGEADNGEDAFRMIEENRPELVITDIRMPVLDGLELIRRVNEAGHLATKFIIVSGYDEFKYAQQAMRYGVSDFILKPVDQDELQTILLRLRRQIAKDRLILKKTDVIWASAIFEALIKGEATHKNIEEWEQALGIQKARKLFYVFIEINDDHSWKGSASGVFPNEELHDRLGRAIAAMLGFEEPVFLYEHRSNQYGMIVTDKILSAFLGSAERFAVALQTRLSEAIGKTVIVYVGAPVQHVGQLCEAYATAKEALQYKFVQPEGPVVYEKVSGQPLQYIELDPNLHRRLMESVEENDTARIGEAVERIFDAFREYRFAPEAVKTSINQCVFGVIRLIRELNGKEDELASLQPMIGWHDRNITLGELRHLFFAFMSEAASYIATVRKEKAKGSIHKIKSYIDSHFHENISLKSLAAMFYMNPVYLGQLFRKTYGTYLHEYLLHLRVNEAKRLLRQTDLCIYEIAERVGFNNPDYFVTQFKKIEQMTPTEYRNQWLERVGRRERHETDV